MAKLFRQKAARRLQSIGFKAEAATQGGTLRKVPNMITHLIEKGPLLHIRPKL